jgi:Protein of unknown function (DUF4236)
MGFFRFRRRIKIAPGVYWNIGKKGSALSFGGRGLTHTIGPKGSRTTIGIPGTGVSYTHVQPRSTPITPATASPPNPPLAQPPYKTITSRVFYIFGAILLVIWLLSKVFEQSAPPRFCPLPVRILLRLRTIRLEYRNGWIGPQNVARNGATNLFMARPQRIHSTRRLPSVVPCRSNQLHPQRSRRPQLLRFTVPLR